MQGASKTSPTGTTYVLYRRRPGRLDRAQDVQPECLRGRQALAGLQADDVVIVGKSGSRRSSTGFVSSSSSAWRERGTHMIGTPFPPSESHERCRPATTRWTARAPPSTSSIATATPRRRRPLLGLLARHPPPALDDHHRLPRSGDRRHGDVLSARALFYARARRCASRRTSRASSNRGGPQGGFPAGLLSDQYRILQSRSLANRVIGLLQLDPTPEFVEPTKALNERTEATVREWLVRWIPMPPPPAPEAVEDLAVTSPLTSAFLGRLSVEPIRSSRLVRSPSTAGIQTSLRAPRTRSPRPSSRSSSTRRSRRRGTQRNSSPSSWRSRAAAGGVRGKLTKFLNGHDILFVTADRGGQQQDS